MVFLLFATVTFSQENISFTHYSINDGLPNNTVNCTFVDKYGLLWVGTNSGLSLHSANGFVTFKNKNGDTTSICNNMVTSICDDKEGNVWIGTSNGLSKFNRKNNSFINYFHNPSSQKSLPSNYIYIIYQDENKVIWFGTLLGLSSYQAEKDSFYTPKISYQVEGGAIYHKINCITGDKKGNLWFCTNGAGIEQYNIQSGKLIHHLTREIPTTGVTKIVIVDSKGTIWIANLGKGLSCYKPNTHEYISYQQLQDKDQKHSNFITDIVEFDDNTIWASTDGGGLNIFKKNPIQISVLDYKPGKPGGLTSNTIRSISKTRDGNIWLGTINGGLLVYNKFSRNFKQYTSHYQIPFSISNNAVSSVHQDKNNRIWVGTHGGGLNEFIREKETFRHIKLEVVKNEKTDIIYCLESDNKGNIWIGTYSFGLICYRPEDGKIESFMNVRGNKNSIGSNNVYDIKRLHDGNLILGTNLGVTLFNPETKQFTRFHHIDVDSMPVLTIFEDSRHKIWIGSQFGGLYLLDPESGVYTKIRTSGTDNNKSPNIIAKIMEDSKGSIWVSSTRDGLLEFIEGNSENMKRHYPGIDIVYSLLEDSRHNLWIGSKYGLVKYNPTTGTTRIFDRQDGLIQPDFMRASAVELTDGSFIFGTTGGMLYFNPDDILPDQNPANVIFTNLYINNNRVEPGQIINGKVILPDALYAIDAITLTWQEKEFSIEISDFNFANPIPTDCYYKLSGIDSLWKKIEYGSHRIKYTFLPPGSYTLQVKTVTNEGIESKTNALRIVMKSPFWKKAWFIILSMMVIIAIISGWMRARTYYLRLKKAELEKIVKQRTTELEQSAKLLLQRQEEILIQKENLEKQSVHLQELNQELETQKEEIENQNEQLFQHKTNLEQMVKDRTIELETALVRAEESDKLKSSFLSNLSHEIRTPMNAIIGFSSLLEGETEIPDSSKEFLSHIQKNAEGLMILIDDIIDISKIEANTLEVKTRTFSFDNMINDFYHFYDPLASSKNLIFKIEKKNIDKEIVLNTDPVRLKQIIANLLSNAIKYTEKGEVLLMVILNSQAGITINIKDTGIGINEEKLSLILKPFTKLEDNNDKIFRGAGLGLSIAYRLSEILGFRFTSFSEPGKGSSFTIEIPKEYLILR
ncbi:MAG: two-component regulator propeller domain-containing protein [Bacteroidales bacterium]